MRKYTLIVASVIAALLGLAACSKSSPPPEEPVKPRLIAAAEIPPLSPLL